MKLAVACGAPKLIGMAFGVAGLAYLDSGVLTADRLILIWRMLRIAARRNRQPVGNIRCNRLGGPTAKRLAVLLRCGSLLLARLDQ